MVLLAKQLGKGTGGNKENQLVLVTGCGTLFPSNQVREVSKAYRFFHSCGRGTKIFRKQENLRFMCVEIITKECNDFYKAVLEDEAFCMP